MDEEYDDDIVDEVDDSTDAVYEAQIGRQRHDVRRRIEELLERKRMREEFGELSDF